ncbi:MAG: hypothetical protein OXK79_02455 [Chloroflexota bacterium]|nr:hypothetical protein [Chloroflexota bacterium]
MSDPKIQRAVVDALEQGDLWTSELIECLADRLALTDDPTWDSIKAAIWDLAESQQVRWAPDGRLALVSATVHG